MSDDPFSPYPDTGSIGAEPEPEPEPPRPKQEYSQPVEDLTRKFVSARAPAPAPTPSLSPVPCPLFPMHEFIEEEKGSGEKAFRTVAGFIVGMVAVFIIGGGGAALYFLTRDTENSAQPVPQSDNLIVAADGGEVTSEFGASVIIPHGALAEDTEITISRVALGDVTDRFELQPHGLEFLKPVTILVPYKESGFKAGKTSQDIRLKYWSDNPGFKRENLSYTVNSEDKILSTEVTHF